jgi:hypothetical protein
MDEDEDIGGLGSAVTGEGINALMTPGLSSADARAAYSKAQGAVEKQISANLGLLQAAQDRLRAQRVGPSDAEKYFAIAAALGQPTRTGSFGETVGNLGTLLGKYSGAKREAESERESLLEKLGMQTGTEQLRLLSSNAAGAGQLMRAAATAEAAAAKASQPIFRGTAEMGGKVVMLYEDPRTGKVTPTPVGPAKQDLVPVAGVTSGNQPVFRMGNKTVLADGTPVTQFDKPPRKLSATEQKQIFDVEEVITSGKGAISAMQQALALNDQAYEGSLSGARKMLGQAFASDDPTYVATESLDNLITRGALESLRATFGGNPTEGERRILLELQASSGKPRAVRQEIYQRALQSAQARIDRESKRLLGLRGGEYGVVQGSGSTAAAPSTPSKPGKPRILNWKN